MASGLHKSALALHCGYSHTVIIPGGGQYPIGWGLGLNGELSIEDGITEFDAHKLNLPRSWTDGVRRFERTQAAVGASHTAFLFDGALYTMGSSANGRLGHENERYGKVGST